MTSEQALTAIPAPVVKRSNEETRFRPGTSGNPGGRPRRAKVARLLLRQLNAQLAEGTTRGDIVADAVVSKAEAGDLAAATFIRDTVDGTPARSADSTINMGLAVTVNHVGVNEQD